MRTFLIGVDGSEASDEAIKYCRDTFDPEGEEFIAVNIVPAIPDEVKDEVWDFETSEGTKNVFEMESEFLERAEDFVAQSVEPLVRAEFSVAVETKMGHPGSEICHLATANDVDGIVIGRSGKGIMSEMVLGSVSHHVIHHADRPVIVVPRPGDVE